MRKRIFPFTREQLIGFSVFIFLLISGLIIHFVENKNQDSDFNNRSNENLNHHRIPEAYRQADINTNDINDNSFNSNELEVNMEADVLPEVRITEEENIAESIGDNIAQVESEVESESDMEYTLPNEQNIQENVTDEQIESTREHAGYIDSSSIAADHEDASETARYNIENDLIRVTIKGAVNNPGEYYLSSDSDMRQLIEQSGNLTPNADEKYICFDLPLLEGQIFYIPEIENDSY